MRDRDLDIRTHESPSAGHRGRLTRSAAGKAECVTAVRSLADLGRGRAIGGWFGPDTLLSKVGILVWMLLR